MTSYFQHLFEQCWDHFCTVGLTIQELVLQLISISN